jgi:D-arabinose 1-dehydrogenase-like Zn-dependent alcohol dehydrogenase
VFGSTLGNLSEMADLLRLADTGRLKPVIDSRYPLQAVPDALSRLESQAQFGKVVIDIVPPGAQP